MRKITEVEQARALMTEATDWSVMKWLRDKKHVRKMADKANEALWALQKETKASWSNELKAAYNELVEPDDNHQSSKGVAPSPEVRLLAKHVKEMDDEAYRAHMDAEDTFALAEKRMSTSMAKDGCRKAIYSWELYEKAISKAEAAMMPKKAVG
jgi:hypothetical protein